MRGLACLLAAGAWLLPLPLQAQGAGVEVRLQLPAAVVAAGRKGHAVPAVAWLKSADGRVLPQPARGPYTLTQRNRMFTPHLLVVPVGSAVLFPNADPFFHNVFSLFDGKRFDLGLYEAGTTRAVNFSREGLSYIFCNIHPEMSAVVLALSTPLYAEAEADGAFHLQGVPGGEYELHVWVEGETQAVLEGLTRRVHVGPGRTDLGTVALGAAPGPAAQHTNKFGQPYGTDAKPVY